MQFRPLLFVVYFNTVFLAYWIYYEVTPNENFGWLSSWFICVALGGGQNYCAESITLKHINSFPGFTIITVRFLPLFPLNRASYTVRALSSLTAGDRREHRACALLSLRHETRCLR